MEAALKIGWIGLGNMGNPMANNLLNAGLDLTVYNRTKNKEESLLQAGARSASSPQALMDSCDIIITI